MENASKYPEVWKRRRQKEEINNFFAMIHLLKTKKTPKDFVNTLFVWGYDTFLKEYKKKHKSETALVDGMIKRIKDSLDVCDNMPDWFAAIETNDQILRQNTQKKGDDCVTLSTLHGAKGLEWQDVFIINVNQGTIPFTFQGECDLEEERRLFYVGITRAKTNLYLISDALKDASQFLQEM